MHRPWHKHRARRPRPRRLLGSIPQPPAPDPGYTQLLWARAWAAVLDPTGAKTYTTIVHLNGHGLEFCWTDAQRGNEPGQFTLVIAGTTNYEGGNWGRALVDAGNGEAPWPVGAHIAQITVSNVSGLAFKLWEQPPPGVPPAPPSTTYVSPNAGGGEPDLPYPYHHDYHHDYDHWWDWF